MSRREESKPMKISVYLGIGSKRTFAGGLEWPGWCRGGKDEASALQALLDYAPRYAAAMRPARLGFQPPDAISAFTVAERLRGDSTTDFGAPGCIPARDADPVDEAELRRLQSILKACWRTLDRVAESAEGKTLRSGPRGGGRDLKKMVSHVREAEKAYLSKLGWKPGAHTENTQRTGSKDEHWLDSLNALTAAAHGKLPARGPRGGAHWPPRYFTRRSAWHILDHAWEIEDRAG